MCVINKKGVMQDGDAAQLVERLPRKDKALRPGFELQHCVKLGRGTYMLSQYAESGGRRIRIQGLLRLHRESRSA